MAPTRISKKELEDLLNIEFDYEARIAFLKMSNQEQLMAVLAGQAFNRGEIAKLKKDFLEYKEDARVYRREREQMEKENGTHPIIDTLDLSRKIAAGVQEALAKRFDFWVYLRDRVAPQIITAAFYAIIIILGLFLSGKLNP